MHLEILTSIQKKLWAKLHGANLLNRFYLAGGTAIALYLRHRESVDFDFFTEDKWSAERVIQQLSKISQIVVIEREADTLHLIIDGVKTSFLSYPYPMLAPLQKCDGVNIADLQDIVPMKLVAVAQRGTKKDFFDIHALNEAGWSLEAMFEALERKFSNVHYNKLHILKSLTFFKDAERDAEPRVLTKTSWIEVKESLVDNARRFTLGR